MRLSGLDHPRSKKRIAEGSDGELSLLYYLFRVHHWTPEMYAAMGQGGRDLAWAMVLQEIDDKAQAGLVRQRK